MKRTYQRECPKCLGDKNVMVEVMPGAFDFFGPRKRCPTCHGRGTITCKTPVRKGRKK